MRRRRAAALLPAAALVAGCVAGGPSDASGARDASGPSGTLTVFAAASLRGVFEALATELEAEHPGADVTFSFAGSSDLVSQVLAGAPADVLATADEGTMDRATAGGAVDGTPTVFAENVLVLVVPPGNPAGVTGLDASLGRAKLVVCAPQVPCGAATQRLAELAGVTLRPVSEESAVTDVLGKVSSGQADAGLVYATDAQQAGDAVEVVPVPGADRVVNRYPVAVLAESENPELARLWVDTLTGDAGSKALADAGFRLP